MQTNKKIAHAVVILWRCFRYFQANLFLESWINVLKLRNICVTIFHKFKRAYYENLNVKNLSVNRKFWGSVKPLFSSKVRWNIHITLNENHQLIRNEYQIGNIFNNFFIKIVPSLGIKVDQRYICNTSIISDSIEKANKKCKNRPSISIIKNWCQVSTIKLPSLWHLSLQICHFAKRVIYLQK